MQDGDMQNNHKKIIMNSLIIRKIIMNNKTACHLL